MLWASLQMVSLLPLLSLTSTAVDVVDKTHLINLKSERTTTTQMLRSHGYRVQEHYAITDDGYVLKLFRIPPLDLDNGRPPVLLQHGLLSSSDDWVMNGPGRALAQLLADAGFDVWLGNGRGNVYSRNHVLLNAKNSKFWKFSWHEQGVYDLPAVIDHILHVTGHRDIFYMAHSMGTTMFFVMMSEKPEYNKKIRAAYLMAPVAYMGHITSKFLKLLAEFEGPLTALLDLLGVDEFEPSNDITKAATDLACSDHSLVQELCSNIVFNVAGYNEKEINEASSGIKPFLQRFPFERMQQNFTRHCCAYTESMLPLYLAHTPAGASVRQLDHYGQEIKCGGHFRKYDFGPSENRARYGRRVPPDYRLSAVTAPVALIYGDTDCLAPQQDVERAYKEIKNPIGIFRVDGWSHLDFVWGIHAKELVYDNIIRQMSPFLQHPHNDTRKWRPRHLLKQRPKGND